MDTILSFFILSLLRHFIGDVGNRLRSRELGSASPQYFREGFFSRRPSPSLMVMQSYKHDAAWCNSRMLQSVRISIPQHLPSQEMRAATRMTVLDVTGRCAAVISMRSFVTSPSHRHQNSDFLLQTIGRIHGDDRA